MTESERNITARNQFIDYLKLRFTEQSKFDRGFLLNLFDQISSEKIITKAVLFGSEEATNGNGKTALIKRLIKNSQMTVVGLENHEVDGIAFKDFESLSEYVNVNDNLVVILNFKFMSSHEVLIDSSFKTLHDIIMIGRKKNVMVILEHYNSDSNWKYEKEFRFSSLFDLKIELNEKPPIEYRKDCITNQRLNLTQATFDYLVTYTSEFTVSEFHACIDTLKALSTSTTISNEIIKEVITFLGKGNLFDEVVIEGIEKIDGRTNIKRVLENIVAQFKNKTSLQEVGITKVLSYMFVGPPGTGKTFAVRCLAGELGLPIEHVTLNKLERENQSVSNRLHVIFKEATKNQPKILFFDEAEKLFGKHDILETDGPIQGEFQQLIDGADDFSSRFKGMLILNANDLSKFSKPLLDRFKIIKFDLPSKDDRAAYLGQRSSKLTEELREKVFAEAPIEELANTTNGKSYREIERYWTELVFSKINQEANLTIEPIVQETIRYIG